jgi:hypothetical protein
MARHKGAAWLVVARGRQRRCCRGSVRYPAPRGVRERAVPRPVVWCARARARRPGQLRLAAQLGLQRTGPEAAAWWRLAWRAGARRRGTVAWSGSPVRHCPRTGQATAAA